MTNHVTLQIKEFLESMNLNFKIMEHEPTPTSQIAAKVRGTSESQGAKALVLRSRGNFLMCVLPGNLKVDLAKVRRLIGEKSLSMATPEEVEKVTGCKIGGVPPFGNLFNIPIYLEKNILRNEEIAFNAGTQTISMIMKIILKL